MNLQYSKSIQNPPNMEFDKSIQNPPNMEFDFSDIPTISTTPSSY